MSSHRRVPAHTQAIGVILGYYIHPLKKKTVKQPKVWGRSRSRLILQPLLEVIYYTACPEVLRKKIVGRCDWDNCPPTQKNSFGLPMATLGYLVTTTSVQGLKSAFPHATRGRNMAVCTHGRICAGPSPRMCRSCGPAYGRALPPGWRWAQEFVQDLVHWASAQAWWLCLCEVLWAELALDYEALGQALPPSTTNQLRDAALAGEASASPGQVRRPSGGTAGSGPIPPWGAGGSLLLLALARGGGGLLCAGLSPWPFFAASHEMVVVFPCLAIHCSRNGSRTCESRRSCGQRGPITFSCTTSYSRLCCMPGEPRGPRRPASH